MTDAWRKQLSVIDPGDAHRTSRQRFVDLVAPLADANTVDVTEPEDLMNVVMRLQRPEGVLEDRAHFECSIRQQDGGKGRRIHGRAMIPFTLELTIDGWKCSTNNSDTDAQKEAALRLAIFDAVKNRELIGQPAKSANQIKTLVSGNRNDVLRLIKKMLDDDELVPIKDKKNATVGFKAGKLKDIPF